MVKNIIILGASSGLGKELALLLNTKDNRLFLLSRHINKVSFLSKNIIKIVGDLASEEDIKNSFLEIDKYTKNIDVFINCVGIGLEKPLETSFVKEIKEIIQVNLIGAILATREAYTRMLKKKTGHIINIASTSGIKAREAETIYCASKWGLRGFNESLRLEAKKYNIRVSTISPGGMKTNFYKNNPNKNIENFMPPKAIAQQIVNIINTDESICPAELVIERN